MSSVTKYYKFISSSSSNAADVDFGLTGLLFWYKSGHVDDMDQWKIWDYMLQLLCVLHDHSWIFHLLNIRYE